MKHWSLIFVATIAIALSSNAVVALSPPIEPLSWDEAHVKAEELVKQMSLEQIASITKGSGLFTGQCVGNAGGTTHPDFPSLCLADGPLGVRGSPFSSAFAAGITAAASFDKDAIRQRGIDMGAEFRGKGANVQLGPSMNIARNARAGRNWEAFGEVGTMKGLLKIILTSNFPISGSLSLRCGSSRNNPWYPKPRRGKDKVNNSRTII